MKITRDIFFSLSIIFFNCEAQSTSFEQQDFYAQASQDAFVYTVLYEVLGKKDKGTYLEIGAGYPTFINNTFFFEKNFNWSGISIEITKEIEPYWYADRKNRLLIEDATQSDYSWILSSFPPVIDYLTLDVDSYYDRVLQKIPLNKYMFKIITIEHDYYRFGDVFREKERQILTSFGYYLLCPDVTHPAVGSFEDWWIHPSAFPPAVFMALTNLDLRSKDHEEIVKTVKNLVSE